MENIKLQEAFTNNQSAFSLQEAINLSHELKASVPDLTTYQAIKLSWYALQSERIISILEGIEASR